MLQWMQLVRRSVLSSLARTDKGWVKNCDANIIRRRALSSSEWEVSAGLARGFGTSIRHGMKRVQPPGVVRRNVRRMFAAAALQDVLRD